MACWVCVRKCGGGGDPSYVRVPHPLQQQQPFFTCVLTGNEFPPPPNRGWVSLSLSLWVYRCGLNQRIGKTSWLFLINVFGFFSLNKKGCPADQVTSRRDGIIGCRRRDGWILRQSRIDHKEHQLERYPQKEFASTGAGQENIKFLFGERVRTTETSRPSTTTTTTTSLRDKRPETGIQFIWGRGKNIWLMNRLLKK